MSQKEIHEAKYESFEKGFIYGAIASLAAAGFSEHYQGYITPTAKVGFAVLFLIIFISYYRWFK